MQTVGRDPSRDPFHDELLTLAVRAAADAGALLLEGARTELLIDTKSSPTDVVTHMDRAAEALLHQQLLGARPDDGILGEEGASVEGTSGVRWVVDPIDGTVNYLYGIPMWAVSVGAEVDGRAVAGVVHKRAVGPRVAALGPHAQQAVHGEGFGGQACAQRPPTPKLPTVRCLRGAWRRRLRLSCR